MIKTIMISGVVLSGVGTSAMAVDVLKPAGIDVTAGTLMISYDGQEVSAQIAEKSGYALELTTKKGRVVAIRF